MRPATSCAWRIDSSQRSSGGERREDESLGAASSKRRRAIEAPRNHRGVNRLFSSQMNSMISLSGMIS